MKTKIIPFDLETAKKIQAGEIEGKILHNNEDVIILDYNSKVYPGYPIRFAYVHFDEIDYASIEGIHIESPYPDNEPQFKPFDKVLVKFNDGDEWKVNLFSHKEPVLEFPYCCIFGSYKYCIPFEGHEYLLGTTDKPKEE